MNEDFRLFLVNLLLSLKQTAPLDENLRAVMSTLLPIVQRPFGAKVSAHVFANPLLGELHVMAIGNGASTAKALRAERHYRKDFHKGEPTHRRDLPPYTRFIVQSDSDFMQMLDGSVDIRVVEISSQMVQLLRQVYELDEREYAHLAGAKEGDNVIVVPLRTGDYWRLGFFILWAPDNGLTAAFADYIKHEKLIAFREDVEKLLIRLFTNFYQMETNTYLPSYYQVERKRVALLCAEIRGFDRISQILRQRHDLEHDISADCLRKLVNRFSETAAQVVEQYDDGRVDQIWGNGLLAVFGQYPNLADPKSNPSCMYAVMAAAEIIERSREVFKEWLHNEFLLDDFLTMHSEHLELEPVVALDYGDAVFDYFGSMKKRVYMTVGDHVNFVKQLVSVAGQKEFEINDYDALLRHLKLMISNHAPANDQQDGAPPLLLSRSAFTGALPALQLLPRYPANWEYYRRTIRLPGKPTLYSVYEIWPENVARQARSVIPT